MPDVHQRQEWRGALVGMWERPSLVCETFDGVASAPHAADFADQTHDRTLDDPKQLRLAEVEAVYRSICERDTGDAAAPDKRTEAEERAAVLRDQTDAIAAGLQRVWFDPYRQTGFDFFVAGVHTSTDDPARAPDKLPPFRRIMILPEVAKKARATILRDVEFWLERHPMARMWVLTSGGRCNLDELDERQKEHTRKVSKLNSEVLMPRGVQIVLSATEHGKPEFCRDDPEAGALELDEAGQPTFHVHTHAIVHHLEGKPLPRAKWEELLRAVHAYWSDWWSDGDDAGNSGLLRKAREVVKYMTKPGEVLKLTDPQKALYAWKVRRLKFVRPMGDLRDQIRSRKDRCMTLDRAPTPDGRVWREVFDWNRYRKAKAKPPEWIATAERIEREVENADRRRRGLPPLDDAGKRDEWLRWTLEGQEAASTAVFAHNGGQQPTRAPEAVIKARLVPGFVRGSLVREPRFVVMVPRGMPWPTALAQLRSDPWWQDAVESTRVYWLAGQAAAAAIRVHTCTPTVRAGQAELACLSALEGPPSTAGPPF